MQNPKVLVLLLSLVIMINYINYILPDRDKQENEIELLEQKIVKEKRLNKQNIDLSKLNLEIYKSYFFDGKQYNYSQAMGKFQEIISSSAKQHCKISDIKWAPVPTSHEWYDILKINLSLECHPKDLFLFVNDLRKSKKLIYTKNIRIMKPRRSEFLRVNMQLVAYRKNSDK